jgi:diketogulonate reductase-like aldo/keto reductase
MTDGPSPHIQLNNGVAMPALGLGVFLSPAEETADAVATAIRHGYRLIDTAAAYGNEREVGEGIRRSGIDRGDVFVTTKLWLSAFGYDSAVRGCEASLRRLGLDHVDLYLLHWPVPSNFDATIASYRALERLLAEGKVRSIGISNFSPGHLETLLAEAEIVPAVNQIELHPYFAQPELREADARHGVVTQSWSPIGGVYDRAHSDDGARRLLDDPTILELAASHGKTPAQVVLRWHIQLGLSTIPKSVSPGRIAENIDIFDFELSPADMDAIGALDRGVRAGADPEVVDAATFAVTIDD